MERKEYLRTLVLFLIGLTEDIMVILAGYVIWNTKALEESILLKLGISLFAVFGIMLLFNIRMVKRKLKDSGIDIDKKRVHNSIVIFLVCQDIALMSLAAIIDLTNLLLVMFLMACISLLSNKLIFHKKRWF